MPSIKIRCKGTTFFSNTQEKLWKIFTFFKYNRKNRIIAKFLYLGITGVALIVSHISISYWCIVIYEDIYIFRFDQTMFFYVYVLECFVLVELYKLVVKAVWKLAYRQILVAFCASSKASKALKGFCLFFSNFIATVIIKFHFIGQKKHPNTCICAIFVVILQRKIVWHQTIKHHNNNLCDFELVFWQPC